jgi:uncharacterized membrane-anchored protein YhcB (DUF1043 family)
MNKFDPNRLPVTAIWTDWDLAKFALIAFVVGVIVGWLM